MTRHSILIHDLKYGSGKRLELGDRVEVHYQVAACPEQLDTEDLLQSTWRDGVELVVEIGKGQLRPEVEAALVGLPIGSDRRLLVPRGTWPDVDRDLAISLVLVGIIQAEHGDSQMAATFSDVASPVPVQPTAARDQEADALIIVLGNVARNQSGPWSETICRVKLEPVLHDRLQRLMKADVSPTLRYGIRHVGVGSGGNHEVEISLEDVRTLIYFLGGVQ